MSVDVGQRAPEFTLQSHLDGQFRLGDFQGQKNVVLVFFPQAWTPV